MRKKRRMIANGRVSKKELAKRNGVSISSLYYQPKLPAKDWHLKNLIEGVLHSHPAYGYRRVALELGLNNKRVKRVMHNFGIKPYRRRGRKWRKSKENGQVFPNLLQQLEFPEAANIAWVSDFTHIPFHSKVLYLATIKDIFDRTVVGWSLLSNHSVQLTIAALIDAVEKHGRPVLLHSDQGSEYKSKAYTQLALGLGIKLSMSHKGSPWENGYRNHSTQVSRSIWVILTGLPPQENSWLKYFCKSTTTTPNAYTANLKCRPRLMPKRRLTNH